MPPIDDNIKGLLRGFPGHTISAVAQRGNDVLFEGVFKVDDDGDTINRDNAQERYLFPLGSGSKIITGVAFHRLLQIYTNVDIDSPISKYGFDFDWAETVTIRSLLTHESGLPQANELVLAPAGEPLQDKDSALKVINSFASSTTATQPGPHRFCYSNLNYILLALVMEKICEGKKYDQIVKDLILVPFKMDHTYVCRSDLRSSGKRVNIMVSPHMEFGLGESGLGDFRKTLPAVLYLDDTAPLPAFGIISCWQDMKRFFSQLLLMSRAGETRGETPATFGALDFLAANQKHLMGWDERYGAGVGPWTGSHVGVGSGSQYAQTDQLLGRERPKDVLYHAGSVRGYECSYEICPSENWFVLGLSNATSLGDVADDIRFVLTTHVYDLQINDFDSFLRTRQARREDRVQVVKNLIEKFRGWTVEPSADVDVSDFAGRYIAKQDLPSIRVDKRGGQYSMLMETLYTKGLGEHHGQELSVRFLGNALTICPESVEDFILHLGNDFLNEACLRVEIKREANGRMGLIRRFRCSSDDNSMLPIHYCRAS